MEHVTVRAAAEDGRVAHWEPRPNAADVWVVADGGAYRVPLTSAVAALIARGVLVVAPAALPTPAVDVGQDPDPRPAHGAARRKR